MGCYDTVMVPCPKCGNRIPFQSKSGECILAEYDMEEAPEDVLRDVNRHAPYECEKCRIWFQVEVDITPAVIQVVTPAVIKVKSIEVPKPEEWGR